MASEVIQANLQLWRQKALAGTLTLEESREAIAAIRKERAGASEKSTAAKTTRTAAKAKNAPIDSDKLLGELF